MFEKTLQMFVLITTNYWVGLESNPINQWIFMAIYYTGTLSRSCKLKQSRRSKMWCTRLKCLSLCCLFTSHSHEGLRNQNQKGRGRRKRKEEQSRPRPSRATRHQGGLFGGFFGGAFGFELLLVTREGLVSLKHSLKELQHAFVLIIGLGYTQGI